jgi:hypothetical protein
LWDFCVYSGEKKYTIGTPNKNTQEKKERERERGR